MKKRILSMLLTICMLLTMMPAIAFAADGDLKLADNTSTLNGAEIDTTVTNGHSGANIKETSIGSEDGAIGVEVGLTTTQAAATDSSLVLATQQDITSAHVLVKKAADGETEADADPADDNEFTSSALNWENSSARSATVALTGTTFKEGDKVWIRLSDGADKTYYCLTVKILSSCANLTTDTKLTYGNENTEATIDAGTAPEDEPEGQWKAGEQNTPRELTAYVPNGTTDASLTLSCVGAAKTEVEKTAFGSGTTVDASSITLTSGQALDLYITVTAEDAITTGYYKLTIKESEAIGTNLDKDGTNTLGLANIERADGKTDEAWVGGTELDHSDALELIVAKQADPVELIVTVADANVTTVKMSTDGTNFTEMSGTVDERTFKSAAPVATTVDTIWIEVTGKDDAGITVTSYYKITVVDWTNASITAATLTPATGENAVNVLDKLLSGDDFTSLDAVLAKAVKGSKTSELALTIPAGAEVYYIINDTVPTQVTAEAIKAFSGSFEEGKATLTDLTDQRVDNEVYIGVVAPNGTDFRCYLLVVDTTTQAPTYAISGTVVGDTGVTLDEAKVTALELQLWGENEEGQPEQKSSTNPVKALDGEGYTFAFADEVPAGSYTIKLASNDNYLAEDVTLANVESNVDDAVVTLKVPVVANVSVTPTTISPSAENKTILTLTSENVDFADDVATNGGITITPNNTGITASTPVLNADNKKVVTIELDTTNIKAGSIDIGVSATAFVTSANVTSVTVEHTSITVEGPEGSPAITVVPTEIDGGKKTKVTVTTEGTLVFNQSLTAADFSIKGLNGVSIDSTPIAVGGEGRTADITIDATQVSEGGTIKLQALDTAYANNDDQLTSNEVEITVTAPVATVTGTITDPDSTCEDLTTLPIKLIDSKNNEVGSVLINGTTYTFTDVPYGDYTLKIAASDTYKAFEKEITVGQAIVNQDIALEGLEKYNYTFTVQDSKTQTEIDKNLVSITVEEVTAGGNKTVDPDPTDKYKFVLTEGKTYTYTVTSDGYEAAHPEKPFIPTQDEAITISLNAISKAYTVTFKVNEPDAQTVIVDPGKIVITEDGTENTVIGVVVMDEEGATPIGVKFDLENDKVYTYTITPTTAGYQPYSGKFEKKSDTEPVEITDITFVKAEIAPPETKVEASPTFPAEHMDVVTSLAEAPEVEEDTKTEVTSAASTNAAIAAEQQKVANDKEKYAAELVSAGVTDAKADDVITYVKTYLSIRPSDVTTDATANTKTLVLDITPMAQVVATTTSVTRPEDAKTEGDDINAVNVGEPKELEITKPVTITLNLGTAFTGDETTALIKHYHKKGISTYRGTINAGVVTFRNRNGFSTFEVTVGANVENYVNIGDVLYNNVMEAIANSNDGDTIEGIKADGTNIAAEGVETNKTITIPVLTVGSKTLTFAIPVGSGIKIEGEEGVTVTQTTVKTENGCDYIKCEISIATPKAETPIGLAGEAPEEKDGNGKITGLKSGEKYEYISLADTDDPAQADWSSATAFTADAKGEYAIASGKYLVRVKAADDGSKLASDPVQVEVPGFEDEPAPIKPGDDDERPTGGGSAPAKPSGSGSSGGWGGGSTPTTPPVKQDTNVTVPSKTTEGVSTAEVVRTTADKMVSDAVKNDSDNVNLKVEAPSDAKSVTVTMPSISAKDLANKTNANLNVETPLATVTIPNSALGELAGKGKNTVGVTVEKSGEDVKITLKADGEDVGSLKGVKAEFPAKDNTGTVAVMINPDGTEKVLKKIVVVDGKINVPIDGSATVRIVDRSKDFNDIANHWAGDSIAFVTSRDLFNGVSETEFAPNAQMTRAMLVTVLHRLEDIPAAGSNSFNDVPANTWYTNAVSWAAKNGIVTGKTSTRFAPNDPITREQLATILYRYADKLGLDTSSSGSLNKFTDKDSVSSYAYEAVAWAVGAGIINGKTPSTIEPKGNATRAEVSTMLMRLVVAMN